MNYDCGSHDQHRDILTTIGRTARNNMTVNSPPERVLTGSNRRHGPSYLGSFLSTSPRPSGLVGKAAERGDRQLLPTICFRRGEETGGGLG